MVTEIKSGAAFLDAATKLVEETNLIFNEDFSKPGEIKIRYPALKPRVIGEITTMLVNLNKPTNITKALAFDLISCATAGAYDIAGHYNVETCHYFPLHTNLTTKNGVHSLENDAKWSFAWQHFSKNYEKNQSLLVEFSDVFTFNRNHLPENCKYSWVDHFQWAQSASGRDLYKKVLARFPFMRVYVGMRQVFDKDPLFRWLTQ